jgi:WD40 repeat protein
MLILLNELDTDLTKIDFTGCLIRRVDFANRKLRVNGVNFSRAQFDLCRFNWSFGPVQSVAISKNRNFVVAGTADKKLLFWQLGLRRPRAIKVEEDVSAIWALTLDRDGTQLASCSETSITVWELSISPLDGGSPGNFTIGTRWNRDKAHAERIHSLTFDSDGKVILSASADGTIAIHHAATGELISMQAVSNARDAQTRPVRIALFSPDNQFIATAGRDGLIRLWAWDGASVSLLHQVTSGQEWVESLAFSPDGRLLASGGKDGTIRIWDVRNIGKRKCLHILTPHTDWVTGISFTSDGKSLLSVSDDKFIKQSNFASGKVEIGPSVLGGLNWINSMALSIDNKAVVTCSTDKTVRVWDMPMLTESRRLNGYTNPLWSIAIDPSGSRAACAYDDGDVREWEIASGKLLRILPSESESFELDRHTNHVRAIAYRADGQRLFSGGDDHNIIVWDDHTSTPVEEKIKLPERIRSLSVSPNGRYLAVGNTSSSVNFVDTYFPKLTRTLSGHFDSVSAVAFNHSGTLLATGSYDATIRLWNIDQIVDQPASSSFQTPSLELRHTYKVRAVVFGHDDKWIAAGGYDGRLIVWQLDGNNIVERNILAHSEAIRTLAVSQNGQWLASGCHDGKIKLWNLLDQWRPIDLPVASNVAIRTLAFAQNKLLSGGDDGVMRIWDTTGDFTNLQNMKPRTVVVARPYENMRITDANGLSVAQQKALISLGACR